MPEAPKLTNLNLDVVDDNDKAMLPTTAQIKILEPEMIALQRCLKACYCQKSYQALYSTALQDTIIKTGQVYSFYADTHRLYVNSFPSHGVVVLLTRNS